MKDDNTIQSQELIPVFTGILANEPAQLVNARDLHAFLEVGRDSLLG